MINEGNNMKDITVHNYRVLAVDDNEACAKTMMWTMEMLGHNAKFALDGPTAISLAKTFLPDIVFMDIGMPEMNGYEVCQIMQKDPAFANTTFIAVTGWGGKEHQERSKEAGFHYHLLKPIDIEKLKKILLEVDKNHL
ncbi:MAG: response regulator [Pseudomonadota bacterium]